MTIITKALQVFKADRFKVDRIEYSHGDGQSHHKDVVRHPGAVVILAITDSNEIVFVKQPRVAVNAQTIELPAGTLENREDPLLCAQRELAEEAGYAASRWERLGELYPAPGFCDERQHLFVARGLSEHKLPADPQERIEVCHLTVAQVVSIVKDGTLKDAKSLALLFRAKVADLF